MNVSDTLRFIDLVIGVIVLCWLLLRRVRHPDWYPRGGLRRDIWAMSLLWDFALIVSCVENLIDTGTYVRVIVSMAAILTTLAVLVRPYSDWPGKNT